MTAPAREAAFRTLRALAADSLDLGEALSRSRDKLVDARDRALATDLAIGTLRWRGAIDYQLQRLSARPLDKLDAAVLDALRLGAYQLLYLERVPERAAVHDSVEIVKAAGARSAASFVNAILRRLARERGALVWPDRSDLVEHFSVVHSHPAWLVERWLARYGEEVTEQWLRFNNTPPAMTLAANRLLGSASELATRLRHEGVETRPTTIAPHGLVVVRGRALASQAFASGSCLVQDEASQIVGEVLQARPGDRVFDACASPGGKTIAAAAQCAPNGLVVAADVRRRRVELLASTVQRCRATNVRVVMTGAHAAFPLRDAAVDRLLIDAPCSGLGTLRRDPDIRWRRTPDDFPALAQVQHSLLQRARRVVASGGYIVYSTCSSEPEENEQVVTEFLAGAPEFSAVPLDRGDLPAGIARLATAAGHLRTSPTDGLEAFFAAVLRKR